MNAEVMAVVEKEDEEKRDEGCTECVVVELGKITKDTLGYPHGAMHDMGAGRWIL